MIKPEQTPLWSDWACGFRWLVGKAKNFPSRRVMQRKLAHVQMAHGVDPLVNYGRVECRGDGRLPIGGEIKLIPLKERFPEQYDRFHLIYLVSSALPQDVEELVRVGKSRGAKLVWNQNGIAYPGCYGHSYPWLNLRMASLRAQADYIFDQSEFSRISANRYLGPVSTPSEIAFNPVDLEKFSPASERPDTGVWHILAAGTSHAPYRTLSVIDTVKVLIRRHRPVHLTIAGEFRWKGASKQVERALHDIQNHVTILPPFRQSEAPGIYRKAHLLLHTKVNDPCPTVPIEAMASGVPVVGTRSGGMPELVPASAGVLVPIQQSWTSDLPGDPELLANAIETIMQDHRAYANGARTHAVRSFDLQSWLEKHEAVFQWLLDKGRQGTGSR